MTDLIKDSSSPPNNPVRILLADDHTLIAEAVGLVLSKDGFFEVDIVETFNGALSALSGDVRYDIIMLDLRMPGVAGLDSVKRAVDLSKGAKVTLFTAHADRHVVKRAVALGACGVIPKNLPLQSLESVLRLIHSGQMFLPSSLMESEEKTRGNYDLTQVELLVLKLAAEGMTNKRIANDIGASEATIKMHMRTLCKKLDAKNRAHAAIIARNNSLIDI
jgi:two-component system nitrate/nitrite response regulator NarP